MSVGGDFFSRPERFGIASSALVRLDGELTSDHAAYLDLTDKCDWVKRGLAVIQDQGNALLYLLSADVLKGQSADALREWLNVLACRGDARYMAVVHPGRLDFYPLLLRAPDVNPQAVHAGVSLDRLHDFLIGAWVDSASETSRGQEDQNWLDDLLFKLLFETADALRSADKQLTDGQVLSLVGRALFTRFIADRGILKDNDVAGIAESTQVQQWTHLFDSPQAIACTCAWLDLTFNGNLLPVIDGSCEYPSAATYQVFFQEHPQAHKILSDVLHSAPGGQRHLGWHDIQFQHVPADMLSQVYEQFAHKFQASKAKSTSIYYTPRHIAQQLVNAAFAGSELQDKSRAHVLDPSAGAGVFLVLAYKRLAKERWQNTGKRPRREELRAILNEQLCGLDINEQSLKFASLSLYLTALELDPSPQPLVDLKFTPLNQSVLWCVDGLQYEGLGSLHQEWADHPDLCQRFDMVVGNPPWTKPKDAIDGSAKTKISSYTKVVHDCAKRAGIAVSAIRNLKAEQGNPDPVFVWRSLGWAKPSGMLAFALHAQHMLFQKGASFELRQALLSCVELTGVVNGSALRKTEIWRNQDAPFCLWIARNRPPESDSCFYYLNPYPEQLLCQREQYRLDPKDAQVVAQNVVQSFPDAFKAMSKGSGLDWGVIVRIKAASLGDTVEKYWKSKHLYSSVGCKTNRGTDESAIKFNGMPLLTSDHKDQIKKLFIDIDDLPKFEYKFPIDRARSSSIYREPLVLFVESPYKNSEHLVSHGAGAFLSMHPLVYNYSFFGYSCSGHEWPELLARYLQLISVSSLFNFVVLLTSSKFGVEREALQKDDIDQFPFVPLESLTAELNEQIAELSAKLSTGEKPWSEINEWARKIYKLSKPDMQVIEDTLRTAWPSNNYADKRPDRKQFLDFASTIQSVMQPFADIAQVPLNVEMCPSVEDQSSWEFVRVAFERAVTPSLNLPDNWQQNLALANQFWASQVKIYADESQRVVYVGQLAHNRYWTKTRARMLAMDLLDNDLEQHGQYAHHAQHKGGY